MKTRIVVQSLTNRINDIPEEEIITGDTIRFEMEHGSLSFCIDRENGGVSVYKNNSLYDQIEIIPLGSNKIIIK